MDANQLRVIAQELREVAYRVDSAPGLELVGIADELDGEGCLTVERAVWLAGEIRAIASYVDVRDCGSADDVARLRRIADELRDGRERAAA